MASGFVANTYVASHLQSLVLFLVALVDSAGQQRGGVGGSYSYGNLCQCHSNLFCLSLPTPIKIPKGLKVSAYENKVAVRMTVACVLST